MASRWGVFSSADYAGVDQGVDFRGTGPIPALDAATVTDVGRASIVEGGTYPYIVYRLDAGPYRGHFVYLAENFAPTVHVGQHVKQGQAVGMAKGSYPYIEIGFNKTPTGWNAVAPLGGATAAGAAMKKYIYGLLGTAPPVTVAAGASDTGGAAGGSSSLISHVPGVVQAEAVGSFFGKLTDPHFWLRALEVIGGAMFVLLGLYLLTRQAGVGGGAVGPPPGLSDETLAELQRSPGSAARPRSRPRKRVHEVSDAADRRRAIRERASRAEPSGEIPF